MALDENSRIFNEGAVAEQNRLLRQLEASWRGDINVVQQIHEFDQTLPRQAELLTKISLDFYDNLLLQNLSPAFDDVPMRRVFPFCVSIKVPDGQGNKDYDIALNWMTSVIKDSDCDLVQVYPVLQGSRHSRTGLRDRHRRTRRQFNTHNKQRDLPAKLKDLATALGATASAVVLIANTFMYRPPYEPPRPPPPVIQQIKRDDQLNLIPKLLDTRDPKEFADIINSHLKPR